MKLTFDELIKAIELDRRADDCGPGCPTRAEAIMILRKERKAADAVLVAAVLAADTLEYHRKLGQWPSDADSHPLIEALAAYEEAARE